PPKPLESRIASGALPTNLDAAPAAPSTGISVEGKEPLGLLDGKASNNGPPAPPSPSQRALSVLEGMAVCEVAWHEGGSLPETLYACLYLHPRVFTAVLEGLGWVLPAPSSSGEVHAKLDLNIKEGHFSWKPADRALTLAVLAQSLGTLRCCSVARDVIILADIFEEEDFYPSTFGFRLTPPVEDDSLRELLDLAGDALRDKVRTEEAGETAGGGGGGGGEGEGGCCRRRRREYDCILAHLESRKELLHACLALRDAFTNKQRLRRLKALEKKRADQASRSAAAAAVAVEAAATEAGEATEGLTTSDRENGKPGSKAQPSLAAGVVDVDGGKVGAAAAGVVSMAVDERGVAADRSDNGGGGGGRGGGSGGGDGGGGGSGDGGGGERDGGGERVSTPGVDGCGSGVVDKGGHVASGTMRSIEEGVAGLAVEGRTAGTPIPDVSPPAMASAGSRDGGVPEDDDSETPLAGIARCGGHLRAATAALESLLVLEVSLERGALAVSPSPKRSPTACEAPAVRNRPLGERKEESPDAATGRPKAAAAAAAVKLGGLAGAFAFEAEMNLHLLGSSPHHHVHFREGFEDGLRALLALAREAERACGVVECEDLLDTRRYLLRFSQISAESGGPTRGSNVIGTATLFARSVAAVCLYRQDMVLGRFNVMWFVAEAMTDVGVPDAVVNSPAGMAFLERVGKPVYETLRVLCLNRARQRSSLEIQMQDWRTLQSCADTVDDAFQLQYGLATTTVRYMAKWALSEVLGLMHRFLQIGVELQLPSEHEWPSTYWYWDYVMTTKIMTDASLQEAKEQLEAVKTQMEEERTAAKDAQEAAEAEAAEWAAPPPPPPTATAGKKNSKKKKRSSKKKAELDLTGEASGAGKGGDGDSAEGPAKEAAVPEVGAQPVEREIRWAARRDWDMADLKLRQCLCRGQVRLLAGLESLGIMGRKAGRWPDFRFTSPEIVHRERFRAFQALDAPAFQTHEAFRTSVDFDDEEACNVVDAAAECFRAARALASDQLRRGELLAKAEAAVATAAAATAAAAAAATAAAAAAAAAAKVSAPGGGENSRVDGSVKGAPAPAGLLNANAGGWVAEKAELMALAKLAVANGVVAMQVAKRSKAVGGAGPGAKLEFGAHGQFPVVKA
ncbi:unnamed protein product, partial [Laminaria digitata]